MATRKDPMPFDPKPWKAGALVELDGVAATVWSDGPLAASVWAVDAGGRFLAIKKPTPTRPARVLENFDGWAAVLRHVEGVRHGGYVTAKKLGFTGYGRQRAPFVQRLLHSAATCEKAAQADERQELTSGARHAAALELLREQKAPSGLQACDCLRNGGQTDQAAA
ncbi:hypothetical protein [Arthrobacter sp. B2a2-09]|uniref:hypothetical protein n=1 Tax=Arthrobacter sp. B2a2-09 TaxID=2952822 RepID=UPI0022CD356B|nr:hypothetical protein [Arthrobacter sp. B2a2-09]MCZ9884613.1 hypothetical protein [Arthrobacter sp. B2a2-09]